MHPYCNSIHDRIAWKMFKFWDQYKSTIYILHLRFILVPDPKACSVILEKYSTGMGIYKIFGTNINPQFIYYIWEVYWSQFVSTCWRISMFWYYWEVFTSKLKVVLCCQWTYKLVNTSTCYTKHVLSVTNLCIHVLQLSENYRSRIFQKKMPSYGQV